MHLVQNRVDPQVRGCLPSNLRVPWVEWKNQIHQTFVRFTGQDRSRESCGAFQETRGILPQFTCSHAQKDLKVMKVEMLRPNRLRNLTYNI